MITFGIPFYSGMEYLERTIRSVVGQTSDQWQAIVCDDRGPADAEELVRSFQDPRIQYVRNEHNLGMVGNWNRCLDLATTDLVTILHSDDELLPNYCGLMSRKAAEFPEVAALYCHARFIGPRSQYVFSLQDVVKGFLEPRQGPDTILRGSGRWPHSPVGTTSSAPRFVTAAVGWEIGGSQALGGSCRTWSSRPGCCWTAS